MEAQQYHYQYQTHNDATSSAASLSYDPSQVQSYDQSYYAYHHHHYNQPQQHQQDYSPYYYPDYSNSYQTHHPPNDPNSIHPPGVPIPAETQQSHLPNTQNLYYSHGVSATQPSPSQGYILPGHSSYRCGGCQTGQSQRGGGRGTFGRHGRGRGGARGKHVMPQTPGSSGCAAAAPGKPPPQKAWCELCKVECNTLEILEQHKNGKKHQKNLKVHEELQNLSRKQTTQNTQMPVAQSKPGNIPSNKNEASTSKPAPTETKAEVASRKDETARAEPSSGAPSEKSVRKDHVNGRVGFKRSMRGCGGKWMKAHDGSRRPVEPQKPKGFPVVCELCNVKCESQVVFESHIVGKRHLANAKKIHGRKEAFGEVTQALYPTIPNLLSTSIIPQANQQGPQDAQALASMMLSQQNLQDPQAVQAALAQLLSQHGIHDTQTLLVQLIPYLLAQFQPVAGFGMVSAPNPQSQGVACPAGVESQTGITESRPEQQQNVTNTAEAKAGDAKNNKSDCGECLDKPVDRPPENDSVGKEQVSSGPAKQESSVSEEEKQSS